MKRLACLLLTLLVLVSACAAAESPSMERVLPGAERGVGLLMENGRTRTVYFLPVPGAYYDLQQGQVDALEVPPVSNLRATSSKSWLQVTPAGLGFRWGVTKVNTSQKTRAATLTLTGSGYQSKLKVKQLGTDRITSLKRSKKKYRTTVISITVSVTMFIALSSFMSMAFGETDRELKRSDYNINVNLAYETILQAFRYEEEGDRIYRAAAILANKTGFSGMLGGQGLDVENEKNGTMKYDEEELLYIYEHKTAALLEAAMMVGAVLGGATREQISAMEQIGNRIGLAFQIRDDILDVTSTQEELGKPVFSDARNEKTTFVTLYTVEQAAAIADRLTEEALEKLKELPGETEFLENLFREMAGRKV